MAICLQNFEVLGADNQPLSSILWDFGGDGSNRFIPTFNIRTSSSCPVAQPYDVAQDPQSNINFWALWYASTSDGKPQIQTDVVCYGSFTDLSASGAPTDPLTDSNNGLNGFSLDDCLVPIIREPVSSVDGIFTFSYRVGLLQMDPSYENSFKWSNPPNFPNPSGQLISLVVYQQCKVFAQYFDGINTTWFNNLTGIPGKKQTDTLTFKSTLSRGCTSGVWSFLVLPNIVGNPIKTANGVIATTWADSHVQPDTDFIITSFDNHDVNGVVTTNWRLSRQLSVQFRQPVGGQIKYSVEFSGVGNSDGILDNSDSNNIVVFVSGSTNFIQTTYNVNFPTITAKAFSTLDPSEQVVFDPTNKTVDIATFSTAYLRFLPILDKSKAFVDEIIQVYAYDLSGNVDYTHQIGVTTTTRIYDKNSSDKDWITEILKFSSVSLVKKVGASYINLDVTNDTSTGNNNFGILNYDTNSGNIIYETSPGRTYSITIVGKSQIGFSLIANK